jgi:hypothetical protein
MSDEELCKDARLAAKCLKDTDTFPTGQGIFLDCADRIEALLNLNEALVELMDDRDAKLAKAVEALVSLVKQASTTSSRGAVTGPHWTHLTVAILKARAVLAEIEGEKG